MLELAVVNPGSPQRWNEDLQSTFDLILMMKGLVHLSLRYFSVSSAPQGTDRIYLTWPIAGLNSWDKILDIPAPSYNLVMLL